MKFLVICLCAAAASATVGLAAVAVVIAAAIVENTHFVIKATIECRQRQSRHLFEAICQKLEKTKEDGNPLTPNYQEIYDIALRGCRQTAPRHSRLGSKVSEFLHSCTERMGL